MNKLLKVLFAGTVINFITVPFLFSQSPGLNYKFDWTLSSTSAQHKSQNQFDLSLKHIQTESADTNISNTDSTITKDSVFTSKQVTDKKFKMKKKPWVAVLLSATLPGAGQFYNRSYWKVPLILGLAGYFGYEYWREDKNYRDYRDRYSASQNPQNPEGDDNLKSLREFYRNERGNFTWYFMIVYFINLVDAYVDAHLFDFDVRDEKINTLGRTTKKFELGIHIPIK